MGAGLAGQESGGPRSPGQGTGHGIGLCVCDDSMSRVPGGAQQRAERRGVEGRDAERQVCILIFKVFALELGECCWEPVAQTETEGGGRGVATKQVGHPARREGAQASAAGPGGWGPRAGITWGWPAGGYSLGRTLRACWGVWGPEVGWASFPSNPVQFTSAWMSLSLLQN